MPNQPSAQGEQPPPDLPNMPDVSNTLANYLRAFSLWCRNGFRDKMPVNSAVPGLMLLADDSAVAPAPGTTAPVWILRVKSNGTIVATPVALGGGRP